MDQGAVGTTSARQEALREARQELVSSRAGEVIGYSMGLHHHGAKMHARERWWEMLGHC